MIQLTSVGHHPESKVFPDREMQEGFLSHFTLDISAGRYAIATVAALIAGVTDALWLKISNWLTFPLLASGLLFHAILSSETGVLFALMGAFIGFCPLVILFISGGVGAGDLKLLAGIGAWIGPHDVLVLFIVSSFLVGFYSLILRACTTNLPTHSTSRETVESLALSDQRTRRTRLVPMGTMIAVALLILVARDSISRFGSGI
jgi:prepilin peptidase CpaA